MHDGGEAEAGAGALSALIENRHTRLTEVRQGTTDRHLDEGRLEHAITEVEGVWSSVEGAGGGLAAGRTGASARCRHCAQGATDEGVLSRHPRMPASKAHP